MSSSDCIHVAHELTAAGAGSERRRAVEKLSAHYGRSPQTIYAWARRGGWSSARTRRTDSGTIAREGLRDEHFESVLAHLARADRRLKKPPIAKAILDCERAGLIPRGVMSVSIFSRHCKARGLDWRGDWSRTRARDTHATMRSLPQDVHEIDASVYVHWYLRDDGGLEVGGTEKTTYKNKPGDDKVRVIRWIVTDHCTNAFYVFYTPDEKVESLARVLHRAWSLKTHEVPVGGASVPLCDLLPFAGVPRKVYWDLHGTHWSREIQSLLAALRVESVGTRPFSPRSHGTVESTQNLWERWFELDQVCDPPATISELQGRADSLCAWLNSARPHSRYGRTRSDAWHEYVAAHPECYRPVVPWEIFQRLVHRAEERVVRGDGTIRFDGRQFKLPRDLWGKYAGRTVAVHVSPFAPGWIDVHAGDVLISLPAIELDAFGRPADANVLGGERIAASPATPREIETKQIRARARTAGAGAHHGYGDEIAKRYEAIRPVLGPPVEQPSERFFTEVEARRRITEQFERLTADQRGVVREIRGPQTESEIESAIERIKQRAG